jgi:hypothetical protein
MAGIKIYLTIPNSTLPIAQRTTLLTGIAAEMAYQLAQFYGDVTVDVDDTYITDGTNEISHEITGTISSPYDPIYGG